MLHCGRYRLSLERPLIMGIVNVTPDSFSDGGAFLDPGAAVAHAHRLVEEGADILDIGGESTRPGAVAVPVEQELARVLPVLRGLRDVGVPISVDTVKPEVMSAALAEGASIINDITALAARGAMDIVAASDAAVCLMHMQGEPRTMQQNPRYEDVVREVKDYLAERLGAAIAHGIAAERVILDPGYGFGKTVEHNLRLLREQASLLELGAPILAGWSRKSSLGTITGRPANDRLAASITAAVIAVQNGAKIVRVHDVAATRDALTVLRAVDGQA